MKLSGFTVIRNGVKLEYPFEESIRSYLPLVDELVVNVGDSSDDTLARIQALRAEPGGDKIKIFESVWPLDDAEKRRSGLILSEQTNLALERCINDWCLYLQADEVLHEEDHPRILKALEEASSRSEVEGLLFDYLHFYGSFSVYQQTRSAYRREVRCVRRSAGARSVGDAQSFRKRDHSKLNVIRANARVYHYGWVRPPSAMKEKTLFMDSLYHGEPSVQGPHTGDNYKYKHILGLRYYTETHPRVMEGRIAKYSWDWKFDQEPLVWEISDFKKVLLDGFERVTGIRLFEYRSYRLIT